MSTGRSSPLTRRIVALALILVSFPAIIAIDLFLTEWRVPIRIMYAVPIMVAATLFGTRVIATVLLVAVAFSVVDASLTGIDLQTELLSLLALAIIGLLSIDWAKAKHKAAVLAEERARLYEQERERAKMLEDARALLLEFFAMVAHDLRNPMTTIGGYSQLLSRGDTLPVEQRERLAEGIKSAVRQMTRLANDLQDASRIGTGRFDLKRGRCDLLDLARESVEQRQVLSPGRQLVLEARSQDLGTWCDKDRILQAMGNLIENAMKYSPESGEVRVTLERIDDRARVVVSDQGIGIAPEDVPRLFQPYERLHMTSEIKGLGLGLYIVKGIIEAHGGAVTVQSVLGEGSHFMIELPLEEDARLHAVSDSARDASGVAMRDGERQSERIARSAEQEHPSGCLEEGWADYRGRNAR